MATIARLPNRYKLTLDARNADGFNITDEVEQIGKGRFVAAFRSVDCPSTVYLLVNQSDGDYSKEILGQLQDRPYIPRLKHLGDLERSGRFGRSDSVEVYETVFYRRLNASFKDAWRAYKQMRDAREAAFTAKFYNRDNRASYFNGAAIMDDTLDRLAALPDFPADLLATLRDIADEASNYGASYTFEFIPRNLAVDADGGLILLDPVFDMETVAKSRR